MTLEEYTDEELALLPKRFREQLLYSIPVVDVCRLEGTQFTSEIDMNLVWGHIYRNYSKIKGSSWRDVYFTELLSTILSGSRPYGYFKIGEQYTELNYGHPVDKVNYLVAIERMEKRGSLKVLKLPKPSYGVWPGKMMPIREPLRTKYLRARNTIACIVNRNYVTRFKGVIPPGKSYQETCQHTQLIPPRYLKLFPEGSYYLPDVTALDLIIRKCHYCLKEISVVVDSFSRFLLNFEHEGGSIDCLNQLFQEVESLTVGNTIASYDIDEEPHKINSCLKVLLDLVLGSKSPKLASLNVELKSEQSNQSSEYGSVIKSITPVFSTSYAGLKKLALLATVDISPDVQNLISITDCQSELHTISITITSETWKAFHLRFSITPLQPWFQACFKRPLLQHIILSLDALSPEFFFDILAMFFSAPCSHEQTLTFTETKFEGTQNPCGAGKSFKQNKRPQFCEAHSPLLPLLPTNHEAHIKNSPPTLGLTFDDSVTLLKAVEFIRCEFPLSSEFTDSFATFSVKPLKLKQLVIENSQLHPRCKITSIIPWLLNVETETLELNLVILNNFPFDSLLQKKSIQTIKIKYCSADFKTMCEVAELNGYHLSDYHEKANNILTCTVMCAA